MLKRDLEDQRFFRKVVLPQALESEQGTCIGNQCGEHKGVRPANITVSYGSVYAPVCLVLLRWATFVACYDRLDLQPAQ